MKCDHARSTVLTYNVAGHRWLEQCQGCNRLAYMTLSNVLVPLIMPDITMGSASEIRDLGFDSNG